jgi:SAM-dependent methyltransferase
MSGLNAGAVTAFFDRVALDWDEMRLAYYDEVVIEHLAAAAELDASMTVADVGTGTGFVAAGLAGRVEGVIGIDDSAGMLAVAEKDLSELGVSNVELRRHAPGDGARRPAGRDRRHLRRGRAPYAWMREEHADVWLGFTEPQVHAFFTAAGPERTSIAALGRQ